MQYQAVSWDDYYAKVAVINQRIAAGVPSGDLATILEPIGINETSGGEEVSFWDDLGDLAINVISQELGGGATGMVGTSVIPQSQGGIVNGVPPTTVVSGIGLPPINPNTGQPYKNMKWDPYKGKWVRCRRRRRKLLTESDYNALLKIQTLKNNQNMQVAIAKALSR